MPVPPAKTNKTMTNERDELMAVALQIESALLSNHPQDFGEHAEKERARIEAEAAERAGRLIKAVDEIYRNNVMNDDGWK